MSNASNYVQDTTQTPAWAQAILDRLAALEGNPATEPIDVDSTDEDPAVVPRSPDLDFHPYDDFRKALPSMDKDFFRNPLSEADRRRYLSQCPRNMERNYQPPVLNQVSISNSAKRMDS